MRRTSRIIRRLTGSAFLIALSVILTRFLSSYLAIGGANSLRIGLGTIPIMVGSLVFGPVYGGVIGAAGDLVGALLFPVGPYNPGFTVSALLQGVLPYYTVRLFSGRSKSQAIGTALLFGILLAGNISFLGGHDSYVFTPSFTLRFNTVGKVLYVAALALLFTAVIVVNYILTRRFRPREKSGGMRAEDLFLLALVNETVINVVISSVWKMLYFRLDYVAMFFSATVLLLFDVPIKGTILFLVLLPLSRFYPDWAVRSRPLRNRDLIGKTRLLPES